MQNLRKVEQQEVRYFSEEERIRIRFMLKNLWEVMRSIEYWYSTQEYVENFDTWRKQASREIKREEQHEKM